ncbi:MAG: hypothetical protein IJU83_04235, partial [Clostridia bacterium]|nr:hypothetical protein [Clostridia bacterium]
PFAPVAGLSAGVIIKIVTEILTIGRPEINIYGAAVGAIACYFVADLVNLSWIFPIKVKRKSDEGSRVKVREYANYQ